MSNPRLTHHDQPSRGRRALESARAALAPVGKFLTRDLLSTFLLFASIVLLITFFSLVGSLGSEGQGRKVPLSTISQLGSAQRIRTAELLDYDHQAIVNTDTGIQLYADYPGSDAATQDLFQTLVKGGARVQFNPQSGKSERVIVVQFLIPILLLVCLFAFFMRQT